MISAFPCDLSACCLPSSFSLLKIDTEISVKYHRNFSEIILQHFSEMSLKFQWNITEISVKCHWNFSEISLKCWRILSLIFLYFCEISVIFHWNFSDISLKWWRIISLKFQCYFTEMLENSFTDISVKCQWNFTELIHTPQDPNDKKINKQELFAMKNKQHL